MKKHLMLLSTAIIAISVLFVSCDNKGKADLKTNMDTVAYVIGANIGNNLKQNLLRDSLEFDVAALAQGFRDALDGLDSAMFTETEKQDILMAFQKELQQKQMEKATQAAQPNKEAGMKWLEENKKNPGIIQTPSGLQYKVVKEGNGKTPGANDNVTVHYEGKLIDGTKFDSSYDRKEPISFAVSGVIPGWTEGLQLMKEGGTYELFIPSDLAYGDQGTQGIPGGSTLIFKVELIKVNPATVNPQPVQVK